MAKTTNTAARAMQTYVVRYGHEVHSVLEEDAQIVEARMKAEHRWQNQTGAAEQNLRCEVFDGPGPKTRLVAFHGVPYGKYLETMQQGRFAVLQPTMRSQWPRTLAKLRARLGRLRR